MIWLDTTTRKLEIYLLAAKDRDDCRFLVDYTDYTATTITQSSYAGYTNGVTPVTLLPAPGSGVQRRLNSLVVYSPDFSQAIGISGFQASNVFIQFNDNGTTYILGCWPIWKNDSLLFNESSGWKTLGNNANANAGGRYLRTIVLTGDSDNTADYSGFYWISRDANSYRVRLVAGGGGGGGATRGTNAPGMGGGGSAGGYSEYYAVNVIDRFAPITYTIGKGGAGGANTGGNGGVGGNTLMTISAIGGNGGIGMVTGSTLLSALGGASPALSGSPYLDAGGEPGGYGFRGGSSTGTGGKGGSTCFGEGGNAQTSDAAGNNATVGYGGGGGGACAIASAQVGGKGAPGCIVIDEYT